MNDEFEPFVKRPEVAFPSTFRSIGEPEQQIHRWGMELRDYFAAKAMKYMGLPTKVYSGRIGDNSWSLEDMESFPYEAMSKVAYRWADAMMKAREQ
jgi:hypothetical protein